MDDFGDELVEVKKTETLSVRLTGGLVSITRHVLREFANGNSSHGKFALNDTDRWQRVEPGETLPVNCYIPHDDVPKEVYNWLTELKDYG